MKKFFLVIIVIALICTNVVCIFAGTKNDENHDFVVLTDEEMVALFNDLNEEFKDANLSYKEYSNNWALFETLSAEVQIEVIQKDSNREAVREYTGENRSLYIYPSGAIAVAGVTINDSGANYIPGTCEEYGYNLEYTGSLVFVNHYYGNGQFHEEYKVDHIHDGIVGTVIRAYDKSYPGSVTVSLVPYFFINDVLSVPTSSTALLVGEWAYMDPTTWPTMVWITVYADRLQFDATSCSARLI